MNAGMLWFDDNKNTTLGQKIQKAKEYYIKKYGKVPTLVCVHPNTLANGTLGVDMKVVPYRPVLPGHIWIGMDDQPLTSDK